MAEEPTVELGISGLGPAVRIGSGGFADVYRAQQTNLRREVAVKVLRAPANEEQARMRFERECHAVGAVSGHPNIVGVHEGGFTSDGRAYLVMEYFPGGSLLDRLQRDGPMSAAEVIDIGLKIGRALGVAHDAGVLHRDVKPANILISAYGEPALADFGIARVEGGQQTATGLVTASFAHASPEVLEGGAPSAPSDIYSLGSTLFELFTGNPPHFKAGEESVWALMNRVVSEPVPDPTSVGMPEPLAVTVRKATLRNPEARHRSTGEFVAQLSGVAPVQASPAQGSPVRPVPPPPPVDVHNRHTVAMSKTEQLPVVSVPADAGLPAANEPPTKLNSPVTAGPSPGRAGPGSPGHVPPLSAPPSTSAPPAALARSKRRRSRVLALAALLLVAAVGGGVAWFVLDNSGNTSNPLVLDFPPGNTGPLDEGESYDLTIDGADQSARFRFVVDGEPVGEPEAELRPFSPAAGRQTLAIEVIEGTTRRTSDEIEIYVIGDLPEPGYRANLVSITALDERWPTAIANFDELVDEGHEGLQILPSDRFPSLQPGYWNLFVPGFGDDRASGVDYCARFGLAVPDQCFVTFFDPSA